MFDRILQRSVAESLAANPRVDDDEIAVECFDSGHVVLRGRAANPDKSTQAVRTAYGVQAVRTVDDQLIARRPGLAHRNDAKTEAAVLNAFIADDTVPAETMYVHASDGTVTLSGRVNLPFQRDDAEKIALGVPGVSQVRNELDVWIAVSVNQVIERVSDAIGEDAADRLSVTARDNVVTVSGTVGSTAERDAAIAAAAGATAVRGVENGIRVLA
jgi:osmotically-inducible protein OsmY